MVAWRTARPCGRRAARLPSARRRAPRPRARAAPAPANQTGALAAGLLGGRQDQLEPGLAAPQRRDPLGGDDDRGHPALHVAGPTARQPPVAHSPNGSPLQGAPPSGTTSRWPVMHRAGRDGSAPGSRAIRFGRPGACSCTPTSKPAAASRAESRSATSASLPGGLTVSSRTSSSARSSADTRQSSRADGPSNRHGARPHHRGRGALVRPAPLAGVDRRLRARRKLEGDWPAVGSRAVWDSSPQRPRAGVERVTAYEARVGQTLEVEDEQLRGTQRVAFSPEADAGRGDARPSSTSLRSVDALTPLTRRAVHPARAARLAASARWPASATSGGRTSS